MHKYYRLSWERQNYVARRYILCFNLGVCFELHNYFYVKGLFLISFRKLRTFTDNLVKPACPCKLEERNLDIIEP